MYCLLFGMDACVCSISRIVLGQNRVVNNYISSGNPMHIITILSCHTYSPHTCCLLF